MSPSTKEVHCACLTLPVPSVFTHHVIPDLPQQAESSSASLPGWERSRWNSWISLCASQHIPL